MVTVTKDVTVKAPPEETPTFDTNILIIVLVVAVVLVLVVVMVARRGGGQVG